MLQAFYPRVEGEGFTLKSSTSSNHYVVAPDASSTPSILSLATKKPATLIKIYEACLKPLYTLNITLLDELHNRSNISLLLVLLHHRFIAQFHDLNGFKKLVGLSSAGGSSEGLTNSAFIRSLLRDFDSEFGKFLHNMDRVYAEVFEHADFLGLAPLRDLYNKIVSRPVPETSELFVLKNTAELETLREDVLVHSKSLQLYKKLDGQFDAKKIMSEDFACFKAQLDRCISKTLPVSDYTPSEDDYALVNTREFSQFNARRLQLLGLFDKRIF